jgi:tetratricopeptide (TPR) repeat protein
MARCAAVTAFVLILVASSPVKAQLIADERSRHEAVEHYRQGMQLMAREQFGPASEQFTSAIGKNPLFTLAHYQLGQAYMALQRYASAIKAYQDCIEADRALFSLTQGNQVAADKQRDDTIRELRESREALVRAGKGLQALRVENQLRELEDKRTSLNTKFVPSGEALLALGSAHFRNGDHEAAFVQWKAAIEVNPKLGEAHNNLAVIHMMNGRKAEAEAAVKNAEKAGFKVNPQLKADIRKLD